jgi:hypothetical protein
MLFDCAHGFLWNVYRTSCAQYQNKNAPLNTIPPAKNMMEAVRINAVQQTKQASGGIPPLACGKLPV